LHRAAADAFGPLGVACFDGSDNPGLQAMLDELEGLIEDSDAGLPTAAVARKDQVSPAWFR
jgi:hypothetical protein